jgi:hypothetical protein
MRRLTLVLAALAWLSGAAPAASAVDPPARMSNESRDRVIAAVARYRAGDWAAAARDLAEAARTPTVIQEYVLYLQADSLSRAGDAAGARVAAVQAAERADTGPLSDEAKAYQALYQERSVTMMRHLDPGKEAHNYPLCLKCHVDQHYETVPDRAQQSFRSNGVSCEACHLGGKEHSHSGGKVRPRFFPASPHLGVESAGQALDPGRTSANINWACGRCHTGGRPAFAAGMSTWNSVEYSDAMRGSCYSKLRCIDCHDPH